MSDSTNVTDVTDVTDIVGLPYDDLDCALDQHYHIIGMPHGLGECIFLVYFVNENSLRKR